MKYLIRLVVFTVLMIFFYLLYAPFPYSYTKVAIPEYVPISKELKTTVNLRRTALCSYTLEQRVFDAENTKVFDEITNRSQPDKLGVDSFNSTVVLDTLPVEGPAFYQVRMSSKCNFVQKWFPNQGEWITVFFEYIKEEK